MSPENALRSLQHEMLHSFADVYHPSDGDLRIDELFFLKLITSPQLRPLTEWMVTHLRVMGHLVGTIRMDMYKNDRFHPSRALTHYNYLRDSLLHATGAKDLSLTGDNLQAMQSFVQLLSIRTERVRETHNPNLQHFKSLTLYVLPAQQNPLTHEEREDFQNCIGRLGATTEIKRLEICTTDANLASALLRLVRSFPHLESLHLLSRLSEGSTFDEFSILDEWLPGGIELSNIDQAMEYIGTGRTALKDIGVPACVHENTLRVFANLVCSDVPKIESFTLYGVGYVTQPPAEVEAIVQGTVTILHSVATSNKYLKRVTIAGYAIPSPVYDALINIVQFTKTHDLMKPRHLTVRDSHGGGISPRQADRLCTALKDNYHVCVCTKDLRFQPEVNDNVKLMVKSYSRLNRHGRAWVMDAHPNGNELLLRASKMLSSATKPAFAPDPFDTLFDPDAEPREIPDSPDEAREKLNASYLFVRKLFGDALAQA